MDTGLENDSEYRYVVRAVRADPRVSAGGPPSDPVTASPADTTPPRPPSNLVVVPSPGALRLAWTASPDDDVALYAVYRAPGAGGLIRVGTALAGTTTFIDRDVRAGTAYRYAVTAIDRARTPNESARSNEADRHRSVSRAPAPRPRVLNSIGAGASIGSLSIGALSIGACSGEEGWQPDISSWRTRP